MSDQKQATIYGEEISKDVQREIVTPDNVKVTVHIADLYTRLTASMIDLFVIQFSVFITIILIIYLSSGVFVSSGSFRYFSADLVMATVFFLSFVFRITYFPFLEIRWRGQTIGKRIMNIKVINRDSGPLTVEAILVRNFVREVEFWIPMSAILSQQAYGGGGAGIWSMVFLLALCALPFTNRERMRGGDMLAGTWVIKVPKAELLSDLSQTRKTFSNAELSHYGIEELHTLDYVLRQSDRNSSAVRRQVANTIRKRIGRPATNIEDDTEFLANFYTAQREYLENKQLLEGQAPINKHTANNSKSRG